MTIATNQVPANGESSAEIAGTTTSDEIRNDGSTYVLLFSPTSVSGTCVLSSIPAEDSGRTVDVTGTILTSDGLSQASPRCYVAGPFKRRNFSETITVTLTGAVEYIPFRPFGA